MATISTRSSRRMQRGIDETERPSLIIVHTTLGFGSPKKAGSFEAHGSPLGPEEVAATKRQLGWPSQEAFFVPDEALQHFRTAVDARRRARARLASSASTPTPRHFPELAAQFQRAQAGTLPARLGSCPAHVQGRGRQRRPNRHPRGRRHGDQRRRPGAARIDRRQRRSQPVDQHRLKGGGDLESPANLASDRQGSIGEGWGYAGRNIFYGVREHAMGSITNGLAYHGGLRAFSATFLVFSDYMRPPMRLAALSDLPSIFVFTHDSIGLGEDGPTHQPIEHLPALRAIPEYGRVSPRGRQRGHRGLARGDRAHAKVRRRWSSAARRCRSSIATSSARPAARAAAAMCSPTPPRQPAGDPDRDWLRG